MPEGRHPVSDDQSVTGVVTRARNGDKQAWGALVERYGPADLVDLPPAPTGRLGAGLGGRMEGISCSFGRLPQSGGSLSCRPGG
jgi:hypothetical protein